MKCDVVQECACDKSVHMSRYDKGACVCALPVAPLVLCLPLARRWELPIAPCFLSQNITSSQGWSHWIDNDWECVSASMCVSTAAHACACARLTRRSRRDWVCLFAWTWVCEGACVWVCERKREHAPNPVWFQPVRIQALCSFHWEPGKVERMDVGNAKKRRGMEREREKGRWMLYHRWVILRRGGAIAVGGEKRNT